MSQEARNSEDKLTTNSPIAPSTEGEITWLESSDLKAQTIITDYSVALRKRSEEEAQLNMSETVSPHYVETAARQLRILIRPRKKKAYFTNIGSLLAGAGLSTVIGQFYADLPNMPLIAFCGLVSLIGTGLLIYGIASDK